MGNQNKILKVHSWHKSIHTIIGGFILTTITFNFLGLQYILSTIGVFLIYSGFVELRKENKWFARAFMLAVCNILGQMVYLMSITTPWFGPMQNNTIVLMGIVLELGIILTFRCALKEVFKKIEVTQPHDPLLWIAIWTGGVGVCTVLQISNSWLVFIPILIGYSLLMCSLHKIGKLLNDAEDRLVNAPAKVSHKVMGCGYGLACILLVTVCGIGVNHIELDATEFIKPTDSATQQMLADMGFPPHIIRDFSEENIGLLSDAIHVETFTDLLTFDQIEKLGKCNMKATTVYIELPDNLLYVVVQFEWQDGKAFWDDGFTISVREPFELLDGKLLYEKKGTAYWAPIPRLRDEELTQSCLISGGVSYPFGSERQRGYVFYRLQLPENQWSGATCLNYVHACTPLQIPYRKPEQKILEGIREKEQHYSNFHLQAYRDTHN